MQKLIIYTDGGSRGNPGPSAIGAAFVSFNDGAAARTYGERIPDGTNNEAEYKAVIFALKKAKQLYGKEKAKQMDVEVRADSELLVRQLNGAYKLSQKHIQELFIEVWNLKTDFKKVDFTHIPREQNALADKMVNEAFRKSEV